MGSESSEKRSGNAIPPQHTPGPWRVVEAGGFWIVPAAPVSGIDELAQELAGPDITIVPVPLDSEANAQFIAAAPDLLAALKATVKWFAPDDETRLTLATVQAAIAKAEGRAEQ